MSRCVLLVLAIAACSTARGEDQPSLTRPDVVRERMRRQFNDLRDIQGMLLDGKLEDAKARAFLLERQADDPGLAALAAQSQAVTDAATSLGEARTVPEACRRVAAVAGACAGCHAHFPKPLHVPPETEPPGAGSAPPARLQLHATAADRLFEGAVLGDLRRWREGVDALAANAVPVPGREALSARLQQRAQGALAEVQSGSSSAASRATAYGEMLVTCAECHAAQVVSSR
jgi:cytochrome c553